MVVMLVIVGARISNHFVHLEIRLYSDPFLNINFGIVMRVIVVIVHQLILHFVQPFVALAV